MNASANLSVVNVHDAKTHFSKLLDRAHRGEEIVIAKAGEPWAKLVPMAEVAKQGRKPGGWPALASVPDAVWLEPLPEDELAMIDDHPSAEGR